MKNVSTVALTLLIGGLGIGSQALALPCRDNNFLIGNYGATLSGTKTSTPAGAPAAGAAASSETVAGFATTSARLSLDGIGRLTGTLSSNANGAFLQGAVTGTYTVRYDDCTVRMTLTDAKGAVQNFDGVIADLGNTVLLIQTDNGAGISGVMQRSRSACDNRNMARSYAFRRVGTTTYVPTVDGSNALTSVGALIGDGAGNFTVTESTFRNGTFSRTVSAGTYTVNYDCSVSMKIVTTTAAGSATTLQGQLVNDDKELLWIQSDNGSSVTGAFAAQ